MKYHDLLFLIILLSINRISVTNAKQDPNRKITKEFITKICSKSSNRPLCFEVLKGHIGQLVAKTSFETLAMGPMNMAEALSRQTYTMIETMNKKSVDPKQVRERYQSCLSKYSTAKQKIAEARGLMRMVGKKRVIKTYVKSGADQVNLCDNKFKKPPQIPLNLKNANQKLKDLCSVIVALCDKM